MNKATRFAFNKYLSRIAELNGIGVSDLANKFTVEPSVTQTLFDKIQQSSSFLKLINMVTVSELTEERSAWMYPAQSRVPLTLMVVSSVKPLISRSKMRTVISVIRSTSTIT